MIKKINFCQNWNHKLYGNYYTTIRRHSDYYQEGENYEIRLNNFFQHYSCIDILSTEPLRCIPKDIIILDTGYPYDDSIEIFRRLNKFKTTVEARNAFFDVMLLVKIKNNNKVENSI